MHTHPSSTLHPRRATLLILAWLSLISLACNLGASAPEPPTLVPRLTATPQPTLGFSGQPQNPAAVAPANVNTPIVTTDLEVASLVRQVETDRLMAHVQAMQNFYTRHVNSTQTDPKRGIGAARRYLEDYFRQLQQLSSGRLYTFTQEFDLNYGGMATKQYNVVAVVQGYEPGAGTVVVGAHYDSIGTPMESGTAYAPGAHDNGSGIAAVLELARILSQRQHRASIMLVLFSAEEVGRRGSIAFVDYLIKQNIDVIGMVNIDGVGNENDRRGNVIANELRVFSDGPNDTSSSRHMARVAEFISFTHGLEMKLTVQDAIDRENRYGDHFSFSEKGIPAIRFIAANEEKANADPTDTIEFVEPRYLQRATQSILVVVAAMADGPRPPRNLSLRRGDGGARTLVWEQVADATSYIVALRLPGSLRYDQQIEWTGGNTITWDGFANYAAIAVAAKGTNGIVGPLSAEYRVPR
ncbi:MAG: M20/M25/M40 family metallo-hydrolase [Anaerolineae bacterium]|nr:M20/M25/M40 family metallo-hydrolase [Anaerolineae bacterium]MDW8172304.1 M20/M25/M40 family metallo-hydrolase [Anaerolineae bacterium]